MARNWGINNDESTHGTTTPQWIKKPGVDQNPKVNRGDNIFIFIGTGDVEPSLKVYAVPATDADYYKNNISELKDIEGVTSNTTPGNSDFCTNRRSYDKGLAKYNNCNKHEALSLTYNPGINAKTIEWALILKYEDDDGSQVVVLPVSTYLAFADDVDWHITLDDTGDVPDQPVSVNWNGKLPSKDNPVEKGDNFFVECYYKHGKKDTTTLYVYACLTYEEYLDSSSRDNLEIKKGSNANGFCSTKSDATTEKPGKKLYHDYLKFTYDPSSENKGKDMMLIFSFGDPHVEETQCVVDTSGGT